MARTGWDKILGHDLPKRFLRSSLAKGRIGHAYAFVGPKGVGKATTALVFAQSLLCPAGAETGEPCGVCRTCGRVERDVHPDVRVIRPEGASIGIEQVRDLQNALALKPYEAERKVAIIDDAEAMTVASQNSLLKVLEEPPGDTVIILVATNASALLPTIRSRCQTVRFQPNALSDVVERLVEQGVPEDRAKLIAAIAEGRIGAALKMAQSDVVALRDTVAAWIEQLEPGAAGLRSVIRIGRALEEDKERVGDYLNLMFLWLRDLVLLKEGAGEAIANQDAKDRLEKQAARLGVEGIAKAMRAVDRAAGALRNHANLRLTVDVMLTHVQRSLAP